MSENIKKAKYRVKNAEGTYDVVYLETSTDQVEGLSEIVTDINTEVAKKANDSEVTAGFQSVGAEIDAVEATAAGLNTRLTKAEGDIVKETADRKAAITQVQGEVSKVASDLANEVTRATNAEKTLGDRVTVLEGEIGTDLGDLRDTVAANTAAIEKEVSDRQGEITRVEGLVSAEEARAKAAEKVNADAIATKVAQTAFDAEVLRVNGELAKKADKTQVATDIAAAVKVEKERALAAEGVLQTNINKVSSDLTAEVTRAKAEEARIAGLANKAQTEVDALEGVVAQNKTAIEHTVSELANEVNLHITESGTAISGINGKITAVEGRLNVVEPKVTTLQGKVATNEQEISSLKAAISDKNSNTLVFASMEEFLAANLSPKVGDLAFVLDVKKAFIYRGASAPQVLVLPEPPVGWVYFDEISTEVDLKDFAKTSFVQAEVAKLVQVDSKLDADIKAEVTRAKNAEAGLSSGLTAEASRAQAAEKANSDAIIAESNRAKGAEKINADAISKEITDRQAAVSAVENKVVKNATFVGNTQPTNGDLGHVWLEIQ